MAPDDAEPTSEQAAQGGQEGEGPSNAWDISKPCDDVQHPYQAEVCQQARVADASESTARLARLIMLIGFAALLILLIMLWPLIAAALAARRAASNNATQTHPATALESPNNEAAQRAYVDVDSLEFVETAEADGVVKAKITFRNSGHTPALKLETSADIEVVDTLDDERLPIRPVPEDMALASSRARLGRDGIATAIVQCGSTPKLADQVTNGESVILVWGAVRYDDIFGRRHRTVFQFFCDAQTLATGEMFRPMERDDEVA